MKKIGLTGNIGSGKTTIAQIFQTLGIPVFNADDEAKKIMSSQPLKSELIELFGNEVYLNGQLNRKYLSKIVFNNSNKLQLLNSLVHPKVNAYFEQWCQLQKSTYIIKEAAIIFESRTYKALDAVICVTCPQETRIERLMKSGKLTRIEIKARISNQWDENKIINLSDYTLDNSGDKLITPQVIDLHNQLK